MPQRNLRRFALWGTWKKNVSFYEAERFVLFFRNASFCGLYNFNSIISGSGQPQIVRSPLEKLKVKLPAILKQKQIATFLDKLQNQIEINNNILHLYLQQKQYLFRQMFI